MGESGGGGDGFGLGLGLGLGLGFSRCFKDLGSGFLGFSDQMK